MSFLKTNSVKITTNGSTYDSLEDFGLAIQNTDYVKEPVQDMTNIVMVPGRNGPLDLIDNVFGEQTFQSREIEIIFGGIESSDKWDQVISEYRNLFEGRTVKLVFATDSDWYYIGRCTIEGFDRDRSLGTFTFRIPFADPFKHRDRTITTTGGSTVAIESSRETVIPTITTTAPITITKGTETFSFDAGTYKNSDLRITEGTNTLTITGSADVTITFREGSL